MSDHPRLYAALDLAWSSSTRDVAALQEQLAVSLHDLEISAIQESDESWRVFFPSTGARDRAASALDLAFRTFGLSVSPLEIADEDWARRSQAHLQPVRVGRFIVAPPWSELPPDTASGASIIRILPSMGFGTGHHATTRLCLRALEAIDLAGHSFLDVGTGSGVLAIAACLLGARPVVAVDADADAIDSARDNLQLNGVVDRVRLVTHDFRHGAEIRARTVAANLTGAVLIQGHLDLAACVEPGGTLVVSGFTSDEADRVLATFTRLGDLAGTYGEDGWSAASLRIAPEPERPHD